MTLQGVLLLKYFCALTRRMRTTPFRWGLGGCASRITIMVRIRGDMNSTVGVHTTVLTATASELIGRRLGRAILRSIRSRSLRSTVHPGPVRMSCFCSFIAYRTRIGCTAERLSSSTFTILISRDTSWWSGLPRCGVHLRAGLMTEPSATAPSASLSSCGVPLNGVISSTPSSIGCRASATKREEPSTRELLARSAVPG